MSLKEKIDLKSLPAHIAIIMDGNGRWAKSKGKDRIYGHQEGVKSVRTIIKASADLGVKYLTLYAFSKENWNRPKEEVEALMEILVRSLESEVDTFIGNDIKLGVIGDIENLPVSSREVLYRVMNLTKDNKRMTLLLALSYSARWEIANAAKKMAVDFAAGKINETALNENTFAKYLTTNNIPDPELLIRTSGEYRISNFLLWQSAYTEFYFTEKFWPDFCREEFYEAIIDFQGRERRFGKTSEQLKGN